MTTPEDWGDSPDPALSGLHVDLRARYGAMLPLVTRIRDNLSGPTVGGKYDQAVTAQAAQLPRSESGLSAVIQVQTAAIRFTSDGTAPTAVLGHRADPGAVITVTGWADLHSFQHIREGAVDAVLAITFYG